MSHTGTIRIASYLSVTSRMYVTFRVCSFTTLSTLQSTQRQAIVNGEMERAWKEEILVQFKIPPYNCLEWLSKTVRKVSQDSRSSSQDSNRSPPDKTRNLLPPERTSSVNRGKHHNINYLEITNNMRPCIRMYYSSVSYCSTCFERHIAHHQKPKNCICSLWLTYVCGLSRNSYSDSGRQAQTYVNQRLQIQFFGLLMMNDVSLETC